MQIIHPTEAQTEMVFREACKWLAKTAPEHADQTKWLIERGMLTSDVRYLTRAARRALDKSTAWPEHLMNTLGEADKDQHLRAFADAMVTVYLARGVAERRLIRLVGNHYVEAAAFDPAKHRRASDFHLLEMTRADIEAVAATDDTRRHQLKMILAIAELTSWDERGSPAIWLWEREYLEAVDGGYRWTEKATQNKKLRGKLERLSSLFASSRPKPRAASS
jgi:hypothetical protein